MALKRSTTLLVILSLLLLPHSGNANSPSPAARLRELKAQITAEPDNLDHYFNLATYATSIGEYSEAERAYLHMLAVDPSLDRVRLDLAMVYARKQQFSQAKTLFETVLAKNPPESVKKNVEHVLVSINKALQPHKFGASLVVGYNYDSNANSAASSGQLTFQDISIPLEDSSREKADGQGFAAATLSHSYRFSSPLAERYGLRWNSSTTLYRTEQASLDALDLLLIGLKTGPVFYLNDNRTQIGLYGNYHYVALHEQDYLRITSGEINLVHKLSARLSLEASASHEYRRFINSPFSSVLEDRTGHAWQGRVGSTFAFTNQDIISAAITLRQEESRRVYYDNEQLQFSSSYTRLLPYDCFANLSFLHRRSDYDGPEPLISSTIIREDKENTVGLTLGKRFKRNITWTIGYQYKTISSTLQNYDYDNHRIATAIGWEF